MFRLFASLYVGPVSQLPYPCSNTIGEAWRWYRDISLNNIFFPSLYFLEISTWLNKDSVKKTLGRIVLNIWVSTDEPPVVIKGSQDTHTDGTPKTPQNSTFCCICFFVTTSSLIPTFDHPNQNRRGCNCIQSRKVYIYIHMYIFKNINAIKSLQLYRKCSCHSYHEWKLTLNSSKNRMTNV